jgi:hypothetical protein
MYEAGMDRGAVDEARAAVNGGRVDQKIRLTDLNQGQRRDFNLPADLLLSYFDPDGLGDMPGTAARFKKPCHFYG